MNTKYKTLQTYLLWIIDMACIVVSYVIASYMRYNLKADYGDKTLHYLVCVLLMLVGTVYTFLANWDRDYIVRSLFYEFMSVIKFDAFSAIIALVITFFLRWNLILSRIVIFNFIWIFALLDFAARCIFKEIYKKHISSDNNIVRVVVVAEKPLVEQTVLNLMNRRDSVGYKVVRAYAVDPGVKTSDDLKDSSYLHNESVGACTQNNDENSWYVGDVHVHEGIHNLTERLLTDPFDEVFINTPN
ncbi:MAG: sugar transferase, partial [Butyrivibrio sp.]|nr:sugar transferase [Butyrivibrio sp.]